MAVSEVSICNAALIHLGQETITSLTDNNVRARTCNQRYTSIRDRLLRKHIWRFSVTRTNLAANTATPEYTWGYEYDLPPDALRIINLKDVFEPWVREGQKILTDMSGPLYLRYIRQVTNPQEYDATFIEYFSTELAIAMCVKLTNSRKLITEVLAPLREELLYEARSTGAMEGFPEEHYDEGSWVGVRN